MNRITQYMIELTLDLLEQEEELPIETTDPHVCEMIVSNYFQNNYDESLAAIHTNMEYLESVPVDFIPIRLFKAAIETGVSMIDWELVAEDGEVQNELKRLRGEGNDN